MVKAIYKLKLIFLFHSSDYNECLLTEKDDDALNGGCYET